MSDIKFTAVGSGESFILNGIPKRATKDEAQESETQRLIFEISALRKEVFTLSKIVAAAVTDLEVIAVRLSGEIQRSNSR